MRNTSFLPEREFELIVRLRGVSNTKAKRDLNFQSRPLEWIAD
jgi:hypothetical protein